MNDDTRKRREQLVCELGWYEGSLLSGDHPHDFMAEGNDMLRAMEAEAAAADSRIAELERRIELFAGSFRDESKLRHALEARHRKLREAMSRLVDELEGFSLKGHYGKCSPPMTDCDGDCANDAWLQEVLAKARRALAEDKEADT